MLRSFLKRPLLAGLIAGFVCGLCAAYVYVVIAIPAQKTFKALRQSDIASSTAYRLTDPLLTVSANSTATAPEFVALQAQIQAYIDQEEADGHLTAASVSFRDISHSDGFSVNPSLLYAPASLTKIPLAMAYYDLAQDDPRVLEASIIYSGTPDLDASEQIQSSVQLVPGTSYSVEDLIEHMIKYSDNNAEQLLANHLQAIGQIPALEELLANLRVHPNDSTTEVATASSYMLFFRVLYNATYLDRDYSEKLLSLMTQGDFRAGISAGVPSSVTVAQKFGDARIANASGQVVGAELQNCGIVYDTGKPYALCVMTKGTDIGTLEGVIARISQLIYDGR